MNRRAFLRASITAALAAPLAAEAQPAGKVWRVGVLSGNSPANDPCLERLRRGLKDLGYVEEQTHVFAVRWSEGRVDTFPALAAELVKQQPDVIVSFTSPALPSLKQATSTIPIVMASSLYPVEQGFIASFARPGGNITGLTSVTGELLAKRLQLLKEAVPALSRLAILRLPGQQQNLLMQDIEAAARQFGVQVQAIELRRPEDLSAAFQTMHRSGAQAVMSTQGPFFALHRTQVAELALKNRLPSLSGEAAAPAAGTLMFYGPNIWDGCRRAANYVDRIVRGAKPADLPVEQPTKFELVINMKTAKALSLTIPPALLLRADQVIE